MLLLTIYHASYHCSKLRLILSCKSISQPGVIVQILSSSAYLLNAEVVPKQSTVLLLLEKML